jgi:hypothetical protein
MVQNHAGYDADYKFRSKRYFGTRKISTLKTLFIYTCTIPCLVKEMESLNTGFQAGPYFPNFPYFLTAALIFLITASKS